MKALIASAASIAFASAGIALSMAATAGAEPREWDIGTYDQCLNDGLGQGYNQEETLRHNVKCCLDTGGEWNNATGKCQSPPKDAHANVARSDDLPGYTLEQSTPPAIRVPLRVVDQSIGTTS